eukprot:gnl/TRDRNA2_/TRDRNA2_73896_c0_seq2.p1 gnl/TRDRNA2_/TRDRNA2_73896_c0~~gnl/TRDRNA2_/TRDRNA2_73896_c0_seq2.p1  ORF type:complete len:201 (+),score=29.16 gnl/TRDRNA2_/TRDRNA2_73896_c0_seq2:926-1528(+)
MIRRLGIVMMPGSTRSCPLGHPHVVDESHGNLPRLHLCKPLASSLNCTTKGEPLSTSSPLVHLAEWIPPKDATECKKTVQELDALIRDLEAHVDEFDGKTSLVDKAFKGKVKQLKNDPCFKDKGFTAKLHCDIVGCFQSGFLTELTGVYDIFRQKAVAKKSFRDRWVKAEISEKWRKCKNPSSAQSSTERGRDFANLSTL